MLSTSWVIRNTRSIAELCIKDEKHQIFYLPYGNQMVCFRSYFSFFLHMYIIDGDHPKISEVPITIVQGTNKDHFLIGREDKPLSIMSQFLMRIS